MNRFTTALAEVCSRHLLDEKWLIAPSLRIGHQWTEAVVRSGQPIVNIHVKTINSLAVDLAAPEMISANMTLATHDIRTLLVDQTLREIPPNELEYFGDLKEIAGSTQAILRTIDALRLANVPVNGLVNDHSSSRVKSRDLGFILDCYLSLLKAERLVDEADVFRMAVQRLEQHPDAVDSSVIILIPADLDCHGLAAEMLESLPKGRRKTLSIDQRERLPQDIPMTNLLRLRWASSPSAAPPPVDDDTVTLFRAVGESNEIRQVIRSCIWEGSSLDEVELLHTDTDTYVPLVFEILASHEALRDRQIADLPVTFAEGLPCSYSKPGRALSAWVDWIRSGYPQISLVRMMQERLLESPEDLNGPVSISRLASVLRAVGIGFGKDRYRLMIDRATAIVDEQRLSEVDDEEETEERQASLERRRKDLVVLKTYLESLLAISSDEVNDPATILTRAEEFLTRLAHRSNQVDQYASVRLLQEIGALRNWIQSATDSVTAFDSWEWLKNLPSRLRILGSSPKPGCLHVSHVRSGGHSGRKNTFIVGLDDTRFPGSMRQDPVLLDSERRALSDAIPTATGRSEEVLEQFVNLLARLRGRVTLSYSCHNLADDREGFPCTMFLNVFRVVTGNPSADIGDLSRLLSPPVSFAPRKENEAATQREWWLCRLFGEVPVQHPRDIVKSHFTHLGQGWDAKLRRESDHFTEYDGFVPTAGALMDPRLEQGPILSASSMETLGTCPRRFFYERALGIRPIDDCDVERGHWLDPLSYGSLLHSLFERFMAIIIKEDRFPCFEQDRTVIHGLLDQLIIQYQEDFPPPSQGALEAQLSELRMAAEIFLREEERLCRETNSRPVYLEASIGLMAREAGTEIDCVDPVSIPLGKETSIRVRGKVDRVDRIPGDDRERYVIWDYKTGGTSKYDGSDIFKKGRILQPYLYLCIANHRLKSAKGSNTEVERFGFFFTGHRGGGKRLEWSPSELEESLQVIQHLCELVGSGSFPATNDVNDCRYCDFQPACGDPDSVTAEASQKLVNIQNIQLRPFRRLRNDAT